LAKKALGNLDGRASTAKPAIDALLKDENEYARKEARKALERMP
jgi:hypothetical protein